MPNFEEIYHQYKDKIFNLCLNYLQNREDAEEAAQSIFVRIYQNLGGFKENSSLGTWIYRLAVNYCLDILKARKRKKRLAFISSLFLGESKEELPQLSNFDHPGVQLEQKEALESLFGLIHQLPEQQKSALILTKLEGLSQKEAAAVLEIGEKALESLLSRARANLKIKLEKKESSEGLE